MRPSILDTLTDEQKDQLYDWLLEMPVPKVAEKLALPVPEGFGIQTHITTLRRFKRQRFAELSADQLDAAAQLANPSAPTAAHDATLDNGIASALKRHFFERAAAPDATDDQLALVARWFHRHEKHKLDVQRVQIARERLAQNNRRIETLERAVKIREDALAFRQKQHEDRLALAREKAQSKNDPAQPKKSDHLGPHATNWKEVGPRVDKQFNITPEEAARRAELHKTWKQPHLRPNHPLEINPVIT